MRLPIYQVDAFADQLFAGNPAAVCLLDQWLSDQMLQSIAAENNLAETAFLVRNSEDSYHLRWFTPSFEIPLCGHATLASAYVLFHYGYYPGSVIRFLTQSGELIVERDQDRIVMSFPAYEMEPEVVTDTMQKALGKNPKELWRSGINYYAVYENEDDIVQMQPDYSVIVEILHGTPMIGIAVTAASTQYDFVSRYFAPEGSTNVTEDPVTGSTHSALVPYWSARLGKSVLSAYQASKRGGKLFCELKQADGIRKVQIAGYVQPYLEGFIEVQSQPSQIGSAKLS